ncbi:DUF3943 domain-containing protein [Variovorax guangxiensis]|uniref:DUF3943 domain-containing protein n=1 Tax=Variovorax guangxiensis TaxID=1775474 RepID=UPI002858168C|nr:DUF3943 domain-containing protein [Variovorax guangxiensis]MDR6855837.1 hypothetical protein [Variovorax guangxiensis]
MPRSLFAFAVLAVLALSPWLASSVSCAPAETGEEILERAAAPEPPVIASADWEGLRRDTWYFVGYQAAAVAVLSAMPAEQTRFDRSNASYGKWRDNVTNPVWDRDDQFVNYVLHPYWGAAYYIRARERGLDRWQSLGYSVFLSAVYEFGAEALFEPVSYQDLFITPLAGWLIGEYVFSPIRESIKAKPGEPDAMDQVALVLTDPLGALNGLTNRIFGVETQVSLAPIRPIGPSGPAAVAALAGGRGRWPGPPGTSPRGLSWGLQLQVRW